MNLSSARMAGFALGVIALQAAAATFDPAAGQNVANPPAQQRATGAQERPRVAEARESRRLTEIKQKVNGWTVGLAGGLLEGAPIRFATEIARVADDGDNLHVLPIVTRGPTENLNSLLYLRGIDTAIINSDSLDEYKSQVPDIQRKIAYVLRSE